MKLPSDSYRTLDKPSELVVFKEKKSNFYAYAFPLANEEEVKPIIDELRRKHAAASHFCYAWQLGIEHQTYRANDDGEPSNTAGMPIYGQIKSFDLTNILVVVARVFGGTKLGVGGLISAYRTSAQMVLETSSIIEKKQKTHFRLFFEYTEIEKVMRVLKQHRAQIISQHMEGNCEFLVAIRKNEANNIRTKFEAMHTIILKTANA